MRKINLVLVVILIVSGVSMLIAGYGLCRVCLHDVLSNESLYKVCMVILISSSIINRMGLIFIVIRAVFLIKKKRDN